MRWLAPLPLAIVVLALQPAAAAGFEGFGDPVADSTYGDEIRFEVELEGGTPDRLQLLVQFPGSDASLVIPVPVSAASRGSSAKSWRSVSATVTR